MRLQILHYTSLFILFHGVNGGLRGKYRRLRHTESNALEHNWHINARLEEEKIQVEMNDNDNLDDHGEAGKGNETKKKWKNKNKKNGNGKHTDESHNPSKSGDSEVNLTRTTTSAPSQGHDGGDGDTDDVDNDDAYNYYPTEKKTTESTTKTPTSFPTKVSDLSNIGDDDGSEEAGDDDNHFPEAGKTSEGANETPTLSPTIAVTGTPTVLGTSLPTKAASASPTKPPRSIPITYETSTSTDDQNDQRDDDDDGTATISVSKTPEPTPSISIIESTENDDGEITREKIYSKLSEEEKEFMNHYEFKEEEEEAAKISLVYFFITAGLMIFTAHQLSENPDGVYSNVCRLMITVTGCLFKIILLPAIKMGWIGSRSGYAHHLVTTQTDFKDPYLRTNRMEII